MIAAEEYRTILTHYREARKNYVAFRRLPLVAKAGMVRRESEAGTGRVGGACAAPPRDVVFR